MPSEITLPSLGENIESGDVLSILVAVGDTVSVDQDLLEIETDKATMPVPSPAAGKITKVLVKEGDTVKIGAALFEVEAGVAALAPAAPPAAAPGAEAAPAPAAPVAVAPAPTPPPAPVAAPPVAAPPVTAQGVAEPPAPVAPQAPAPVAAPPVPAPASEPRGDASASAAGPAVRRLARELGVDLQRVRPSGSAGRITEEDVQAYVRQSQQQSRSASPAPSIAPAAPSAEAQGGVRVEKMSRMRQTIARNMVASYTTIPQLTNFDDVDVTELEELRQQSKDDYAKSGLKLTQLPFLIKAVAGALKLHPIVNASVDMEQAQVLYKEYVNIGIAVDTERGLVVPVLRDVDRMSISQVTRELDRLVDKARDGSLSIDEMRGGTFTISNMGAVGGVYSTPIINPPEVAILLVGRSRMVPAVVGSGASAKIEPRLTMPLSLTYDHRVVDGADAARFVNDLKGFLAAPGRLLLAP
jgi:pyruvate dehydrogenase E2 component (dihydrolipoamide acetyltransferase)